MADGCGFRSAFVFAVYIYRYCIYILYQTSKLIEKEGIIKNTMQSAANNASVNLKVPTFTTEKIRRWFCMLESFFKAHKIRQIDENRRGEDGINRF